MEAPLKQPARRVREANQLRKPHNAAEHGLVGLVNRVWLCGLRVFVDRPAQNRAPLNAGRSEVDYLQRWVRWLLA